MRQRVLRGRLDLAPRFAQLRWDPGQTDGGEHLALVAPRDPARATVHAVLVDLEPALLAEAPDGDVVRLGAGKVVKRGAEATRGHDAEVDLQPRLEAYAGERVSTLHHRGGTRVGRKALDHHGRVVRRDEQVDVAPRTRAAGGSRGAVPRARAGEPSGRPASRSARAPAWVRCLARA